MSDIRYQAPPGTLVYWGDLSGRPGLKSPTVINLDATEFYDRYAEGDRSPMRIGSHIASRGGEMLGGPARDQVKAWLKAQGVDREPDELEWTDWSLRWGKSAPPIDEPNGEKHNPIPVKDPKFAHGETRQVDGVWYSNDLSKGSKGRIPFPQPVVGIDPPSPPVTTPTPPTPPAEPEKPAADALALVRQLRVDVNRLFREAERKAKAKK